MGKKRDCSGNWLMNDFSENITKHQQKKIRNKSLSLLTPDKLSLHFRIVVYGETSERHFRDKAEGRFKRLIVSIVYVFVFYS
jgi:hypothetical protein